jgi:hypothetical protein
MSSNKIIYRDPNFRADQAHSYILLIQAGPESFSYAVVYNNYLVLSETGCPLSRLNQPDEILNARYQKVVIGIEPNAFFMIPAVAFNAGHAAYAARFLDLKISEIVYAQPLDEHNHVVYKSDREIISKLIAAYPGGKVVMGSKGWISLIGQGELYHKNLYLNFSEGKIGILNYKNGKLRFYNAFDIKAEDDAVYFTSAIANDLQLYGQSVKLILSGDIDPEDSYHKKLSVFFDDIEFNNLAAVKLPVELSAHRILSLAALAQCAS